MPYKIKSKRIHTKKFDDCVKDVKRKGGNYNAYAVCENSIGYKGSVLKAHRRK